MRCSDFALEEPLYFSISFPRFQIFLLYISAYKSSEKFQEQ
jgi:hypothetical protein